MTAPTDDDLCDVLRLAARDGVAVSLAGGALRVAGVPSPDVAALLSAWAVPLLEYMRRRDLPDVVYWRLPTGVVLTSLPLSPDAPHPVRRWRVPHAATHYAVRAGPPWEWRGVGTVPAAWAGWCGAPVAAEEEGAQEVPE